MDICAESVNMDSAEPIASHACHCLKCQDPQIVAEYNQAIQHAITRHGWDQEVTNLCEAATTHEWTNSHTQYFNALNQALSKVRQEAECKCHKIHAGQMPWTPVLTQVINQILYWKGIAK